MTADTVSGLDLEKSPISTSDKRAGKICTRVTRREGQAEIGAAVALRVLRVSQIAASSQSISDQARLSLTAGFPEVLV